MRAVGYLKSLEIDAPDSLFDFKTETPQPGPRDLLIRVEAIAVNPLDSVQRRRRESSDGRPLVLGWDAAGLVEAVGDDVTMFRPGDPVFTAGDLRRPGANAEFFLADERLVARKPASLNFSQAASVPLTAITAWEALFDRLKLNETRTTNTEAILLIGAAGGVGSMAVQFALRRTGLRVIATASRRASAAWLKNLGVADVLDHSRSLSEQISRLGLGPVRYVFPLSNTADHWDEIVACLAPEGEIVIVDNPQGLDVMKLRAKAGAIHLQMMWVKVIYGGDSRLHEIGELLAEVAAMIDRGDVKPAASTDLGPISANNLKQAHSAIETGSTIGKITLTGFPGQ